MATNIRSDEDIRAEVIEELQWGPRVQANEIGVAVKDGIVILTGWVDSYLKKVAAEEAAHRVPGVKAVANDIEVRLPAFPERTDADIAAAVVNALRWDAAIPFDKVDVMVSQGWVTLKGEVDYYFQKIDAERAAKRIAGVKGVTNLFTVRLHPLPSDLKQSIDKALIRNAQTDAKHISIEVQGRRVILRGTVHSYTEKQVAEDTAWSAPSVTEVENQIVVMPVP